VAGAGNPGVTNLPDWLPPLVLLEDFGGDWDSYLEAIYTYFKRDFIDSRPVFRGTRLALKRHPVSQGKEATFWHMTSEGKDEATRTPDLRRCERIRWPRPIIEEADAKGLKVWVSVRNNENRINIWLEGEDYVVVLAQRKDYLLPWTAFLVTFDHTRRRLRREFERSRRAQS
jgi:hypothetical protein